MFSAIDWSIVGLYVVLTTWIGHRLKGRQQSLHDFFLGGQNIPWFAVSASIIATTISAVTFIGVPAIAYAAGGNFTYLQLALGGIIARLLIARYLLPRYFDEEYYSPYDFMSDRLGPRLGRITAGLFIVGGVLGQSVRVFATALVIELLTGWSMGHSILIIAAFAILWTWIGGVAAVIWTDVVQFFVLIIGALSALVLIASALPHGWSSIFTAGVSAEKFELINVTADPRVAFTFWAALFALPFQGVAVYGTDHLFTQRLMCCRDASEARKALLWSIVGECIPAVMLLVGVGLFAFYSLNPLNPELAELVAEKGDRIFPIFILTEMPEGMKGLIIAGVLSAAISSLDSILAALSQISVTMFYRPLINSNETKAHYLSVSRAFVIVWGALLGATAWWFSQSADSLITLAFSMTTYTLGPMLGLFILSLLSTRVRVDGVPWAVGASLFVVLGINEPELFSFVFHHGYTSPLLAWPWLFPIGTLVCVGLAIRGRIRAPERG